MKASHVHYISITIICLLNVRTLVARSFRTNRGISEAVTEHEDPLDWMERAGWLSKTESQQGRTADVSDAIAAVQNYFDLPVTGRVDEAFQELIDQPRCSVPDVGVVLSDGTRNGRYEDSGYRWNKKTLTWVVGTVQGQFSRADLEDLVGRAVTEWASPSELVFTKTNSLGADIRVDFLVPDSNGGHGDNYRFGDKDLGHAFYPNTGSMSGKVHMNMAQPFYIASYNPFATDLFYAVVHEIGHTLGLDHSGVGSSVMYPTLRKGQTYSGMHSDDVAGVQSVYGINLVYTGAVALAIPSLCLLYMGLLSSYTVYF